MQTYANFTVGGALSVNCHGRYVGLGPLVLSVRSLKLALHDGSVGRSQPQPATRTCSSARSAATARSAWSSRSSSTWPRTDGSSARHAVMPLAEYRAHFRNTGAQQSESGVSQRRSLRAPLRDGALGHLGRDRGAGDDADPAAAAVARVPAAPVLPLGDLGDAVRQGAAREADRPAALPGQEGALAQLRGRLRRRRARAAERACTAPTCCRSTSCRSRSSRTSCRRCRRSCAGTGSTRSTSRSAMPCPTPRRMLALGAARDLRLRPLPQAAHAREREEPGRRLDARADRRGARGRRHLLPALPAARDHRAVPSRLSARPGVLRAEVGGRSGLPLHQRALGQVLPRLARSFPARGRHRASERVPPGLRRRRPVGRVLPLPADRLSHRARRPLPPPDRRRLQAAPRRGGGLPLRAAGAQGRQALPLRPALHACRRCSSRSRKWWRRPSPCSARAGASRATSRSARRPGTSPAWRRSSTWPVPVISSTSIRPASRAADILERGGVAKQGAHVPLQDYEPIAATAIGDGSVDLVTCYVGLHHMNAERLGPFLASVARILRPGGVFIVRDHDVGSDDMRALVSLAHTVFNAGLGETWETNRAELRFFEPADTWVRRLHEAGFDDRGHRLLQDNDPTRERAVLLRKARRSHQHRGEPRPGRVCMSRIRRRLCGLGLAAALVCATGPMHAADSSPSAVVRSSALTRARGPAHAGSDLPHLSRVVPGAQPGRVRALPVAQRRRPAAFPCSPTSASSGKAMPRSIARWRSFRSTAAIT